MKKLCYICEGLIFVAFGFLMGMVSFAVFTRCNDKKRNGNRARREIFI